MLIIDGTKNQIIDSVDAPVTTSFAFSGGSCIICGVLIDPNTNKAILDTGQGLIVFDPAARTFSGPIQNSLPGEKFGYDPSLKLVLNPIFNLTYAQILRRSEMSEGKDHLETLEILS